MIHVNPRRWAKNIVRSFVFRRELRQSEFVIVSIKKSGRTWLRAMLTHLFHDIYGTPLNLLLDGDNHKQLNSLAPSVLFAHDSDPVASTSDVTANLNVYNESKVILLVRNPADIIVSLYHHYKNRKSGKRQAMTNGVTVFEFAMRPNHGLHTIIAFLNAWSAYARSHDNVRIIRYEDLRADTAAWLRQIAEHLGIEASPGQIDAAVEFASIENLRKLEIGGYFNDVSLRKVDGKNPEGLKVRRGQVNGYKDYFAASECDAIERVVASDLDNSLGYYATAKAH